MHLGADAVAVRRADPVDVRAPQAVELLGASATDRGRTEGELHGCLLALRVRVHIGEQRPELHIGSCGGKRDGAVASAIIASASHVRVRRLVRVVVGDVEGASEREGVDVVLCRAVEVRVRRETRGKAAKFVILAAHASLERREDLARDARIARLARRSSEVREGQPDPRVVPCVDRAVRHTDSLIFACLGGRVSIRGSEQHHLAALVVQELEEGAEHVACLRDLASLRQVDRRQRVVVHVEAAVRRLLVIRARLDELAHLLATAAAAKGVWSEGLHQADSRGHVGLTRLPFEERVNHLHARGAVLAGPLGSGEGRAPLEARRAPPVEHEVGGASESDEGEGGGSEVAKVKPYPKKTQAPPLSRGSREERLSHRSTARRVHLSLPPPACLPRLLPPFLSLLSSPAFFSALCCLLSLPPLSSPLLSLPSLPVSRRFSLSSLLPLLTLPSHG
eukprot:scaffold23209_cov25-Tisochrysis_lutea.AAC.1